MPASLLHWSNGAMSRGAASEMSMEKILVGCRCFEAKRGRLKARAVHDDLVANSRRMLR